MMMLTKEEFYVTEEIEKQVKANKFAYAENMEMVGFPENNPLINWVYESLKNYEMLLLMLNIADYKNEFVINAYYFILNQTEYYEADDLAYPNATELARQDLLEIFEVYNVKKIVLN